MTMMFLAIPAIRVALSVPLDLRSNWVFRMTEDVAGRAEVAAANVRIVLGARRGAAACADRHRFNGGCWARRLLEIIAIEALIGWLLVEWLMADWCRIPFTCSYIPGKGFVPAHVREGVRVRTSLFTMVTTLILRVSLARSAARRSSLR